MLLIYSQRLGNTNNGYVKFIFDYLQADAVTVIPYMGIEALAAFFQRQDKGIIVGCHSSNAGSKEFQELEINGKPLFHIIAEELVKQHPQLSILCHNFLS